MWFRVIAPFWYLSYHWWVMTRKQVSCISMALSELLQDPVLLELLSPVSREIPAVILAAEVHTSWVCNSDTRRDSLSLPDLPGDGVYDSLVQRALPWPNSRSVHFRDPIPGQSLCVSQLICWPCDLDLWNPGPPSLWLLFVITWNTGSLYLLLTPNFKT